MISYTFFYLNFNNSLFYNEYSIVLTFLFTAILLSMVILVFSSLFGIKKLHKKIMHFFYEFYFQLHLSLHYVTPYQIMIVFVVVVIICKSLEAGTVLCSTGDDITDSSLEKFISKEPLPKKVSEELSQKIKDMTLKSDEMDFDPITEKKSCIDKKLDLKQTSSKPSMSLNSDYDFIADDIGLGKEEAKHFIMENKILKLAEISDSKSDSSLKKEVNPSFSYFKKPNEN